MANAALRREVDRGPEAGPKESNTAPVTAIGFDSINVEIRTELLEKCALCALQGKPL
jgi:hypothetical protein